VIADPAPLTASALSTLGIVGVGRLGGALARRLAPHHALAVHDSDDDRARRLAEQTGARAMAAAALCRWADIVLLCLPPDATATWLAGLPEDARAHPLFADTATSFAAVDATGVVGLRPVGQFAAIDHGLPALFITAAPAAVRARLEAILAPVGAVVAGDETMVAPLNRRVTRAALALCREVAAYRHHGKALPAVVTAAALANVATGTLLDYPPAPDNAYTAPLLAELDSAEEARP
jgi:hypothetical protein